MATCANDFALNLANKLCTSIASGVVCAVGWSPPGIPHPNVPTTAALPFSAKAEARKWLHEVLPLVPVIPTARR